MTILWISLAAGALLIVALLYKRRLTARQIAASGGIPAGLEKEYEAGTHPAEDGVAVMYSLTTCRHCVHLKDFLVRHDIPHRVVLVDKFSLQARSDIMAKLRFHNPRGSFPTLVAPGGKAVAGFRESEVRAALGLPEADD